MMVLEGGRLMVLGVDGHTTRNLLSLGQGNSNTQAWREAGPLNHRGGIVDPDHLVVNT